MGRRDFAQVAGAVRRLTDGQAREARLSMEPEGALARRLGVSVSLISSLRLGKTYGPLRPDEREAHERRRRRVDAFNLADYLLIVGNLFHPRDALGDQDQAEALDAAWECAHGRLPHDRTPSCGCWPQEILKTNPQKEATNGSHRKRLGRFEQQARAQDGRPATDRPVSA